MFRLKKAIIRRTNMEQVR